MDAGAGWTLAPDERGLTSAPIRGAAIRTGARPRPATTTRWWCRRQAGPACCGRSRTPWRRSARTSDGRTERLEGRRPHPRPASGRAGRKGPSRAVRRCCGPSSSRPSRSRRRAHPPRTWSWPTAIQVSATPDRETGTGVAELAPTPVLASLLKLSSPQHQPAPAETAQTVRQPAEICEAVERPSGAVGVGCTSESAVPMPSSPSAFRPQHFGAPAAIAQVTSDPATTRVTPVSPGTCTGVDWSAVAAEPIWPYALEPQHHTVASVASAHECDAPAATDVAWIARRPTPSVPIARSGPSCPWSFRPQQVTRGVTGTPPPGAAVWSMAHE